MKMKAIYFREHGSIEKLQYGDLDIPALREGYSLVKVKAVALNHLDIWVRKGWPGLSLEMPHITGSDIAGVVEEGEKQGQEVIVYPGINTCQDEWTRRGLDSVSPGYRIIGEHLKGGLAEYVLVPNKNILPKPTYFSFEEAASILLVGLTAWRMLFYQGGLRAGQSILVIGAGGGVNSISISFAKKSGALVYALTGSEDKVKKAKNIGADVVINYNKDTDWHKNILYLTKGTGVDLVIDNVGAPTFEKSLKAVKRGGVIVTVGNTGGYQLTFDNRLVFTKQIKILGSTMGSFQDFIDMLDFVRVNKITPIIDSVYSLKDGIEAIKKLEHSKQFGKIIVKP